MDSRVAICDSRGTVDRDALASLVAQLRGMAWQADPERGRFTFVSQGAEELLGYPAARWLNEECFWSRHVYSEDREQVIANCAHGSEHQDQLELEYRFQHAAGHLIWLRDSVRLMRGGSGAVVAQCGFTSDVTLAHARAEAQQRELRTLKRLADRLPALLWITDADLRLTYLGGALACELNLTPAALGGSVAQFLELDEASPLFEDYRRALAGTSSVIEHAEHTWKNHVFRISIEPFAASEGDRAGTLTVAWDISEQRQAEKHARFLAISDPLTGLANYRRLIEALIAERKRCDRTQRSFALLMIDMDGLKKINDTYGHRTGSRALCRLARVLREHCRTMDLAARHGGDEFAMILPETDYEAAKRVMDRIDNQLAADHEVPAISASMGIAIYPADGASAQQVLDAADRDLYRRKHAGRASGANRHPLAVY